MSRIKITKGVDIPIKGNPEGAVKLLQLSGESGPMATPQQIALNLSAFDDVKFRLLVREGDVVKIGQPLAENKGTRTPDC